MHAFYGNFSGSALFEFMLFEPDNNFSVMSGCIPGLTSTKQWIKCPRRGHISMDHNYMSNLGR